MKKTGVKVETRGRGEIDLQQARITRIREPLSSRACVLLLAVIMALLLRLVGPAFLRAVIWQAAHQKQRSLQALEMVAGR